MNKWMDSDVKTQIPVPQSWNWIITNISMEFPHMKLNTILHSPKGAEPDLEKKKHKNREVANAMR